MVLWAQGDARASGRLGGGGAYVNNNRASSTQHTGQVHTKRYTLDEISVTILRFLYRLAIRFPSV